MKKTIIPLTLAILGYLAASAGAFILVPNGDFSNGSQGWAQNGGVGGQRPANIVSSGGNPGPYATITPSGGWGILVAPVSGTNSATGPAWDLSLFNLTAGDSITVQWDSINLGVGGGGPAEGRVAGMKIEAWANGAIIPGAAGNSGDQFVSTIGTGATWETYSLTWTLPTNAQGLVLVPLWAGGADASTVGVDNVGVVPEPSTYALLALGAAGLGGHLIRRRRP